MNYTSIKQSKKLLELGLEPESADMVWIEHAVNNGKFGFYEDTPPMILGNVPISEMTVNVLPCWSIGALLDIMPQEDYMWALREEKSMDIQGKDIEYEDKWTGVCETYLEACYKMVVWLLENGYIKKKL